MYSNHPHIVDIEASGLGLDSYPIEVGLALENDQRYCSLIKPETGWDHWDDSAEALHNIPREVLEKKGKPPIVVARELNRLLKDKIVFSDGWVVDEPWIIRLFEAAGMDRQFAFYDIQTILSEKQMDLWHSTKLVVIEELNLSRHRASNDAQIIQKTFARTRELAC